LFPEIQLKDILSKPKTPKVDKLLIILSGSPKQSISTKEIKNLGQIYGLRGISSWNISQILIRSNGKAIKTLQGWELTKSGYEYVLNKYGQFMNQTQVIISTNLRNHLSKVINKDTRNFVEEAIIAFENKLFRSAVVLSWVGAIAVLYDYIIAHKLKEFNTECSKRIPKWKPALTPDDLAQLKESVFLDILVSISVIGKNVKQQLQICLDLRNGCGHPNSLIIAENRVASHIEILILNVFSKFV
jgi:hypothetical protein